MKTVDLLSVMVAAVLCIFGIVLLVRMLRNMEKDRLDTWLGFIKFFLGTFVIGLLGFFAKLSYESRQMAVVESEQIGKYVGQAMSEDLKSRIRFAEYFSTVLPEDHSTKWDDYYDTLITRKKRIDSINEFMSEESAKLVEEENNILQLQDSLQAIKELLADSETSDSAVKEIAAQLKKDIEMKAKAYNEAYSQIEEKSIELFEESKLGDDKTPSGSASITNPDDFVTCRSVENLMPYGRTSTFNVDTKVYVHAFINSPRKEEITIEWKGPNDEVINTMKSTIGINTGRGYRLYDHIRPKKKSDEYSVEMRNEAGERIAYKKFIVR